MTMEVIFTPEEIEQVYEEAEAEMEAEMEEIGSTWHHGHYVAGAAFAHAVMTIHEFGMTHGIIIIGDYSYRVREGRII